MTVRRISVAALAFALAGCGGDAVPEDVPRFDPRDAVIQEVRDATTADAWARADVVRSIDVIPLGDLPGVSDAGGSADAATACQAVSEDYAAAVREAQACSVDGDCAARVCETLCCACEVFVNQGTTEYARLQLLRERWQVLNCATMGRCAGGGCGAAAAASCSAEGRCVTVRDRLTDGGVGDASAFRSGARGDAAMDSASR